MTQEEKDLLVKDLCSRLPYGVKCRQFKLDSQICTLTADLLGKVDNLEPYLRPMSSMTEEEFNEYHNIKYNKVTYRNNWKRIDVGKFHNIGIIPIEEYLDWLNSHHFDYRGLIEKGLALKAPEGMYNVK